jgi:hypothetical protein
MDHGGHGRIEKRDKMSTFGSDWLDGYVLGCFAVRRMLVQHGWARAKGNVKAHISCNVKCPGITPFSHGFTDAYLDAVGC